MRESAGVHELWVLTTFSALSGIREWRWCYFWVATRERDSSACADLGALTPQAIEQVKVFADIDAEGDDRGACEALVAAWEEVESRRRRRRQA